LWGVRGGWNEDKISAGVDGNFKKQCGRENRIQGACRGEELESSKKKRKSRGEICEKMHGHSGEKGPTAPSRAIWVSEPPRTKKTANNKRKN